MKAIGKENHPLEHDGAFDRRNIGYKHFYEILGRRCPTIEESIHINHSLIKP